MGCDIHLCVEVREAAGQWQSVDQWERDQSEDAGDPINKGCLSLKTEYYEDRNYNLFAILADVRNGSGFAGVKTGDGFNVIALPRGLPLDASKEVMEYAVKSWGRDGHSHSWLTVAEIMAFDWTQTSKLSGVVDGATYEEWDRWDKRHGSGPKSYSGEVFGARVKLVTNEAMGMLVNAARHKANEIRKNDPLDWDSFMEQELDGYYTRCEWELPYYKCAGTFLSQTLPRLWRLAKPENVRIVFFFDN